MNKQPSQTVDALINAITSQPLTQEDIIAHLNIMRDRFQKYEAAAYKGLQAVSEYYGVEMINTLLEKSNTLTGREDE